MCGRAKLPDDVSELKQDLAIKWDKLGDYRPRYNVAPTTPVPVITSSSRERTLKCMRWRLNLSARATKAGRRPTITKACIYRRQHAGRRTPQPNI